MSRRARPLKFAGIVVVGFEEVDAGYRGVVRTTLSGGPATVEFSDTGSGVGEAQDHAMQKVVKVLTALSPRYTVVEHRGGGGITGYALRRVRRWPRRYRSPG